MTCINSVGIYSVFNICIDHAAYGCSAQNMVTQESMLSDFQDVEVIHVQLE